MKSHKPVALVASFTLALGLWTPLLAYAEDGVTPVTLEQLDIGTTDYPDGTDTPESNAGIAPTGPLELVSSSEPAENAEYSPADEPLLGEDSNDETDNESVESAPPAPSAARSFAPMAAEGSILTDQISELALALGVDCTAGSTVALSGDITTTGNVLQVNCDVTLDLNGHTLTIHDGSIQLANAVTFTIDDTIGSGQLIIENFTLTGTSGLAGISTTDATLIIRNGTVTAIGARGGAGIGGNSGSNAGTLRIYEGSVSAQAGIEAAGVGGGKNGHAPDTTTVYGGTLTATSAGNVAIGGGAGDTIGGWLSIRAGATVYYQDSLVNAAISGSSPAIYNAGLLYLDTQALIARVGFGDDLVNAATGTILKNTTDPTGEVLLKSLGEIWNYGVIGLTPATGSDLIWNNQFTIVYKYLNGTTQSQRVFAPSISSGYRSLLPLSSIGSGWALESTPTTPYDPNTLLTEWITLVEIPGTIPIPHLAELQYWTNTTNCLPHATLQLQASFLVSTSITTSCDATLDLNGYQLDFAYSAQLAVGAGTQLSIQDSSTAHSGTLMIIQPGNSNAALRTTGATLVISSGNVIAHGGYGAAAIGGNFGADSGTVIINGGTITAQAGRSAAGIGGGAQGDNQAITINGGTVNATGGDGATGIGGGFQGNGGNITITGGQVTATGGDGATGIGGGVGSDSSGSLYVTGGQVTATGWYGIGGSNSAVWFVQDGGEVTATGERSAIGGSAGMGTILILGGTLRLPNGNMLLSDGVDDTFQVWSNAALLGTTADPTIGAAIRGTGQIDNGGVIAIMPGQVFPAGVDSTQVNVNHYALNYDDSEMITIDRIFASTISTGYRTIPTPTRSGHDFMGWLLPDGETQLSDTTMLQDWIMPDGVDSRGGKTITLTAVWERNASGIIYVENGPELKAAMGDQCLDGDQIVLLGDITMSADLVAECDVDLNLSGYQLLLDGFNIQVDDDIEVAFLDDSLNGAGLLTIRNLSAGTPGIDAPNGFVAFANIQADITGGDGADGIGGNVPGSGTRVAIVFEADVSIRGGGATGNGIGGLLVLVEASAEVIGGAAAAAITGPRAVDEPYEFTLVMIQATLTASGGVTALGKPTGMGDILLIESTLYLPSGVMRITDRADLDAMYIDSDSRVLGSELNPHVGATFTGAGYIGNDGVIGLSGEHVLGTDLPSNSIEVYGNHYVLNYSDSTAVSQDRVFAETVSDGYRELPTPARSGYTFTGWLLGDGLTLLDADTPLIEWIEGPADSRGAYTIAVTAQWELTPVIVPPVTPIGPQTPNPEAGTPTVTTTDETANGEDEVAEETPEEQTVAPNPTPTPPPTTPTDTPDTASSDGDIGSGFDAWIWWILIAVLVLAVAGGVGYSIRSRRG